MALTLPTVIFLLITSHVLSGPVPVTDEEYNCIKGGLQKIKWDHGITAAECEQFWIYNSSVVGSFKNGSVECHLPCVKVTSGEIVLNECVNITQKVLCFSRYMNEYRTHFYGKEKEENRSPSPLSHPEGRGRYGIIGCGVLLLMVIGGFLTVRYITNR